MIIQKHEKIVAINIYLFHRIFKNMKKNSWTTFFSFSFFSFLFSFFSFYFSFFFFLPIPFFSHRMRFPLSFSPPPPVPCRLRPTTGERKQAEPRLARRRARAGRASSLSAGFGSSRRKKSSRAAPPPLHARLRRRRRLRWPVA